ncbi:MAG: hypothetical protein ND866_04990 [Pyrinomonadaceae bacterium]|nr:hypothetical protein [Pyrinomonadaceae bacterium]
MRELEKPKTFVAQYDYPRLEEMAQAAARQASGFSSPRSSGEWHKCNGLGVADHYVVTVTDGLFEVKP